MNNLVVMNKLDDKIKLYKQNRFISAIILPVASITVGVGIKLLADNIAPNLSQNLNAGMMTAIYFSLNSLQILLMSNKISFLESLKKEVQSGSNNFNFVEEENFDETVEKMYYK